MLVVPRQSSIPNRSNRNNPEKVHKVRPIYPLPARNATKLVILHMNYTTIHRKCTAEQANKTAIVRPGVREFLMRLAATNKVQFAFYTSMSSKNAHSMARIILSQTGISEKNVFIFSSEQTVVQMDSGDTLRRNFEYIIYDVNQNREKYGLNKFHPTDALIIDSMDNNLSEQKDISILVPKFDGMHGLTYDEYIKYDPTFEILGNSIVTYLNTSDKQKNNFSFAFYIQMVMIMNKIKQSIYTIDQY